MGLKRWDEHKRDSQVSSDAILCFEMRTPNLIVLAIVAGCTGSAVAQSPAESATNLQPAVRLCIPVMENSSTNSVNRFLARGRLINEFKPSKKRKNKTIDEQPITPVALDSETERDARREAGEKDCDYILFTKVVELRGRGERRPADKPGQSVTLGRIQWELTDGQNLEIPRKFIERWCSTALSDMGRWASYSIPASAPSKTQVRTEPFNASSISSRAERSKHSENID